MSENVWEWVILHNITGWMTQRDKGISFVKWCEYMMWRSDGVPVSHSTFALVLGNHKIQCQLQQQGSYVLNTSDFDTTITLAAIRNADGNNAVIWDQVNAIIKRAHIHSSNIPGLPAYWKSSFFEFKARTFFQSYVNKEDIAVFHTGSHAEFHDPFLRRLLSKYVKKISPQHDTSYLDIMNDDAKFTDAVYKYKNVVTHYLV